MTKISCDMNKIWETASNVTSAATGGLLFVGCGLVAVAIAPVVSLVAIPIFAFKALPQWFEHRALYNRTLTNGSRAKFGRIEGQDYTRWDGKAISSVLTKPTWQERVHEQLGLYFHGQEDDSFRKNEQITDNPFQSKDDLDWLNKEFIRREKKDLLDSDLRMIRAFAKALIPIVGFIWVLFTELSTGGASNLTCTVCEKGWNTSDKHWEWRKAIKFHQARLSSKLALN